MWNLVVEYHCLVMKQTSLGFKFGFGLYLKSVNSHDNYSCGLIHPLMDDRFLFSLLNQSVYRLLKVVILMSVLFE